MSNNNDGIMAGVANAFALPTGKGQGHSEGNRNAYKAPAHTAASQPGFNLQSAFGAPAAALSAGKDIAHDIMDACNNWIDGLGIFAPRGT